MKMRNKVDIFNSNSFGFNDQNNLNRNDNDNDPTKKLLRTTDPIPNSQTINVERYLKIFLLFTSDLRAMFSDQAAKLGNWNFLRLLSFLINGLTMLIFIRGVLLAFNDHDTVAYYLGHKSENDAWKHITSILIIWAAYTYLIYNFCFYSHNDKLRKFSWLEPFQVLAGMKAANEFGLNGEMLTKLVRRSKIILYLSILSSFLRTIFGLVIFFVLYNYNFNYIDEQEAIGTVWIFILTIWLYFNSGTIYIIAACYDILCYYFKLRFEKVNADIAHLIDPDSQMDNKDRHALLYSILHEHNYLCKKVDEYNVFWSRIIMYTFFAVPLVCCYTLYQTLFVYHTTEAIVIMSLMAFEAFFMFTKSSVSGSKLAYVAHEPYFQLIRATFAEYPTDLRLQLRILIQRLSGPTISFYCSDLFEVSYKSYFHMILGIGQNFFLLTDFISIQYAPWAQNFTSTPLLEFTTPMIEDASLLLENSM